MKQPLKAIIVRHAKKLLINETGDVFLKPVSRRVTAVKAMVAVAAGNVAAGKVAAVKVAVAAVKVVAVAAVTVAAVAAVTVAAVAAVGVVAVAAVTVALAELAVWSVLQQPKADT